MAILTISPQIAKNVPQLVANNNTWRAFRDSRSVIVFVHGVLSNALACWYNAEAKTYWPDMVIGDPKFARESVFLGGYYTAFDSTDFDLYQCAQSLFSALQDRSDHKAVLDHDRIIFVCHSLGGIVTRYMLSGWQKDFYQKKIGLLLMASPSIGSHYANILGNPIELLGHELGMDLKWGSEVLDQLDTQFSRMLLDKVIPELAGMEACEHRFIYYRKWLGPLNRVFPRIVNLESAGRYFRPARIIPNTDHITVVKPDSEGHDSYKLLREFYLQRVEVQLPSIQGTAPVLASLTSAPPPREFRCSRIRWNIDINEDGDAEKSCQLERIVRAKEGQGSAYLMPPTWVQSGHTSRFEIDQNQSTGFATLSGTLKPRLIRQTLSFTVPPSEMQPQTLFLRSIDFNVFSMDSVEFERKKTDQSDGRDYVQRSIRWETTDELVLALSFPEAMRLLPGTAVDVLAYKLVPEPTEFGYRELYDEDLSIRARSGFSFDPVKRSALLTIQKPETLTAYRLVWRLGAPAASPPSDAVSAIVDINRRALLSVRPLFDGTGKSDPAGDAKKEAVLKALAKFGAQAVAEVNRCLSETQPGAKARIDLSRLDLSLMAVEKLTDPVVYESLQMVASGNVPAQGWRLRLDMGDGIAGRAAKRVGYRIFARDPGQSLWNDAYLPFDDDGPRHDWLLSIPLHDPKCGPYPFGVLNLGAFDAANSSLLKVLNKQSLEILIEYANGDFLTAVLNAVG